MRTTEDWSGREIELAESRRGVRAFVDPLGGLVRGGVSPWPSPEIVQKLYKSRNERSFSGEDYEAVTRVLGFYSDLQSIRSEDAITWSVFGPVGHAPEDVRVAFVSDLFRLVSADLPQPQQAEISLWRRIPHPDTLVSGGPEIDFMILTDSVLVLGEAKWLSSVGTKQGKNRDKDQIQLRSEFLAEYGLRLFPHASHYVVLGASLGEPVVPRTDLNADGKALLLRDCPWSRMCGLGVHPASAELPGYYAWKLAESRKRSASMPKNNAESGA